MINVLFVCLGNICRSPLAEGIFNSIVRQEGLEAHIACDSAGTAAYHIGKDPDPRSIKVAHNNKIILKHKGQQLANNHFTKYDYIIAMDSHNFDDIQDLNERCEKNDCKVFMMRQFDPLGEGDVPDPYYGGEKGFEDVFEMLYRSCNKFLKFIIKEKQLNVS